MKGKSKPFYHELTDEQIDKMIKEKRTVGWLLKNYRQPTWCNYPEALSGVMGCWSLTDKDLRKKISLEYCKNCDCKKSEDK